MCLLPIAILDWRKCVCNTSPQPDRRNRVQCGASSQNRLPVVPEQAAEAKGEMKTWSLFGHSVSTLGFLNLPPSRYFSRVSRRGLLPQQICNGLTTHRINVSRDKLVRLLKDMGLAVSYWPSG